MKTEDEKLKEFFAKHINQEQAGSPDFGVMWEKAARGHGNKGHFAWRIAASVALLVTVVAVVMLSRHDQPPDRTIQISTWNEPTRSLALTQTSMQFTPVTRWISPTDFLLPENVKK